MLDIQTSNFPKIYHIGRCIFFLCFREQNPTVTRIESECFSFPRLWKPSSSSNGILYRTGETVIIADNDEEEIVARVEGCICAVVDEQFHSIPQ